ncbi:MAG: type II secretion system protein GspL [Betaproteobacteria bacterium]
MALTLLIRIPDLPRFDPATPTPVGWTLLDNAESVLRAGEGPLASLPRADRVIALAPVGHLLFIETALPPVSADKRDALLRYAIEDKLTIDPSTVHAVVLGASVSGNHVVAAIDRSWLIGVLQWLRAAGLAPDSLVSSAAGIPVAAGEWALVIDGQRGFAKRADGFVYNLDVGAGKEPPFGLTLALKEAREHQRAPSALVLQAMASPTQSALDPALDAALASHWAQVLGIPVRLGAPDAGWQSVLAAARSGNLLSGEFAAREAAGRWLALLRPALIVLALAIGAQLVFTLIDNARLNGARQALEQELTQVFKTAFPAAQAIIDPPLQMQRNLQQLKRERGLPADADAQMLIARLTGLLQALPGGPATVSALTVRDGIATLDAVLAGAEQRAHLQRAVDRLPGAALGNAGGEKPAPLAVRLTLRAGA